MRYNMMSDEDILKDLAQQFDKIRIQKRLKDTDVEAAGGASRQILSGLRSGKRAVTLKSFIKLLRGIDELDKLQNMLKVQDEYSPLKDKAEELLKE